MSSTPNLSEPKENLKIRVLLVDNDTIFLDVASDYLRRQQELIVVGVISRGAELLEQIQELKPQVILIGVNKYGLETICQLRETSPGVRVIALSLLNNNAYLQAALAAGADDLIHKAKLTTDLLPAIQQVMQSNRSWNCPR